MLTPSATVVITARNAAGTIQRAIRSAVAQGPYPIVLVDDHSADDTAALAAAAAPGRVRIVRPIEHRTLGFARQTGLEAVTTDCFAWLDADDEMLPRRMDRLIEALGSGAASMAIDEAEIVNRFAVIRQAPLPPFLTASPWPVRLFERNYVPAPGVIAFRTALARSLGYDASRHGAEDMDILLRAVAGRAHAAWVDTPGYRVHTIDASHSRQLDRQNDMLARALAKHSYKTIGSLYTEAGYNSSITAWALASVATFRRDYLQALGFVAHTAGSTRELFSVLEPAGPCPLPEAWRIEFHAGTLLALLGQPAEAAPLLEQAEELKATAEGANNLGVVVSRLGDTRRAAMLFDVALRRYPGYLDARLNQQSPAPERLTTHPLRRYKVRDDYSAVA